ncbi:cell division protein FtsA [Buchnera aphidicola]|uniref:Cell division protein FtsA n=1 Tax=Buchnera aphidicola subsp. Tuberolachnus salignus TaxID=98804 RepID=A0A160SYX5_BUCTT|nr:cell division protein FtsA [Buchnera aphidicola]CUR53126.1 Cell division protein FtsA [Buchnera aphidicola (Tuberolachnus salignus)]
MISTIKKNLITGLEIGATKISILIGEILEKNHITIIGFGTASTRGICKGIINNLEELVQCIKKAIYKAETMANCKIKHIYLAISNAEINCQNEIGIVPILSEEITKKDVQNVIKTAKSVRIQNNHHILHVIPQDYEIDHQKGIQNPIGLSGMRMKANVHLITGDNHIKKNIIKAIEKCNLQVKKVIFSGLASSEAILTQEEKNSGVCLVDIGGDIMDINIYKNGTLRHSAVIPYAGNLVTHDIAYAFSISFTEAEKIKIKYGSLISSLLDSSETFEIPRPHEKKVQNFHKNSLVEIIEPRYLELLNLINTEIQKVTTVKNNSIKNFQLNSGIIFTGGASKIKNLNMFSEKFLNNKVQIRKSQNISEIPQEIFSPEYSTTIGLLICGKNDQKFNLRELKKPGLFMKWFNKINNWFKKEF